MTEREQRKAARLLRRGNLPPQEVARQFKIDLKQLKRLLRSGKDGD